MMYNDWTTNLCEVLSCPQKIVLSSKGFGEYETKNEGVKPFVFECVPQYTQRDKWREVETDEDDAQQQRRITAPQG